MRTLFLWGCMVAVLATACQSSPTPGESTASTPTEQSAQPATTPASPPATESPTGTLGPRAQAMRLHDAAMARMDALYNERQRLSEQLSKLTTTTPAVQHQAARLRRTVAALKQADDHMMAWMHDLHVPDSTQQSRTQIAAYWQQQLPELKQVDQQIKVALDSARQLR